MKSFSVALAFLTVTASACACNIPVFRYALERWRPDKAEFLIFYRGELSTAQQDQITSLQQAASAANIEIVSVDVARPMADLQRAMWSRVDGHQSMELPYLVVSLPHPRGPLMAWHGPLGQAVENGLLDSPVRQELIRRLQAGASIVWLLLKSSDEARIGETRELLQQQCQRLETHVQLPEGIGLPGSELYSEVPLLLHFSVLEIDPQDQREQFMVRLFRAFQGSVLDTGEALLIPVFGRGRALEVIPADQLNPRLVEDVTAFLCGACSCQVKEQNPGFDLLLSTDWDQVLFGEGQPLPPPARLVGDGERAPTLLPIPPGR
jgi:hypothetical protein